MSGYIALKNVVLSGIGYTAGSTIPADAVLPSRVRSLFRNGTIANAEDGAVGAELAATASNDTEGVVLPIHTENDVLALPVSREDIVKAIEVLQMKQDDAIAAIAEIESEDALIVIDACTKSAQTKKAIKERVAQIAPAGDDTAEGGDE